ncbi:MAG: hypothetical protein GX195_06195 [Firmicutes bacterium]|jgi:hypothetical protein|nr:hypothetical protein [Bacillota bacterium]
MKCLVCGQAQPDAQAVSLLGCLLCHDCERLIVSVQPQHQDYDAVVDALSACWAAYRGDRPWDELIMDSSAGGCLDSG